MGYDIVIVGGGAGFLSRDGMVASELLDVGRSEILGYGAEIEQVKVESISPDLTVSCNNGNDVTTRSVLVATGLRDLEAHALQGVLPARTSTRDDFKSSCHLETRTCDLISAGERTPPRFGSVSSVQWVRF